MWQINQLSGGTIPLLLYVSCYSLWFNNKKNKIKEKMKWFLKWKRAINHVGLSSSLTLIETSKYQQIDSPNNQFFKRHQWGQLLEFFKQLNWIYEWLLISESKCMKKWYNLFQISLQICTKRSISYLWTFWMNSIILRTKNGQINLKLDMKIIMIFYWDKLTIFRSWISRVWYKLS